MLVMNVAERLLVLFDDDDEMFSVKLTEIIQLRPLETFKNMHHGETSLDEYCMARIEKCQILYTSGKYYEDTQAVEYFSVTSTRKSEQEDEDEEDEDGEDEDPFAAASSDDDDVHMSEDDKAFFGEIDDSITNIKEARAQREDEEALETS
jgi:hypothetical protein